MRVPLQIQPEMVSATREGAVRLLQNFKPALLQVQPFKHGTLICPGRFDASLTLCIRCRYRAQGVMTQAFHQTVSSKPAIRLFTQVARQGTGLGQQILA